MKAWDPNAVQLQFKQHERRKHDDAQRCRIEIRAGKKEYERFYDEETAEETIAFVLGTDAALEAQDRLLSRIGELRTQVAGGRLDASGIHSPKVFRAAALKYLDRLAQRFSDEAAARRN